MPSELKITSLAEADAFLLDRPNFEKTRRIPYQQTPFYLERMHTLCDRLGNPQRRLPVVHVAGTKGKGSTATMIATMLQAAGFRSGLYTSPHLVDVRERISVNGTPIDRQGFLSCLNDVIPAVRQLEEEFTPCGPTYFEILTAMAFLHFAHQVDIAVMEVGLGGRLDSTNVCRPLCCVITNISYDHTRQLGRSLSAIAAEKAGILKPGIPAVSGVTARAARQVIEQSAETTGCELISVDQDFHFQSHRRPPDQNGPAAWFMNYRGINGQQISDLSVRMLGRHQHANAAVALTACSIMTHRGWTVSDDDCRRGLATACVPARLQIVRGQPLVILDTAHNSASMAATVEGLRDYWPDRRLIFVVATTRGKNIVQIFKHVLPVADCIIVTRYTTNTRSNPIEDMLDAVRRARQRVTSPVSSRVFTSVDPTHALEIAYSRATERDVICITGSFFLAAELLSLPTQPHLTGGVAGKSVPV